MVICLERGADLHMAQLMPLPLTVFCSSKILIGFTYLLPAHLGSPGQRAVKCVCVCVFVQLTFHACICVVDIAAGGDSEEQNRKRKHHEISPIKWSSADTAESGNSYTTVSLNAY